MRDGWVRRTLSLGGLHVRRWRWVSIRISCRHHSMMYLAGQIVRRATEAWARDREELHGVS